MTADSCRSHGAIGGDWSVLPPPFVRAVRVVAPAVCVAALAKVVVVVDLANDMGGAPVVVVGSRAVVDVVHVDVHDFVEGAPPVVAAGPKIPVDLTESVRVLRPHEVRRAPTPAAAALRIVDAPIATGRRGAVLEIHHR